MTKGQEPAFTIENISSDGTRETWHGMNKRFYAACAAMQGLTQRFTALYSTDKDISAMVKQSYKIADELLKQELNEES